MQDIIKKKGVREYIQQDGKPDTISRDFYEAVDQRVKELLDRAQDRAQANQRGTVMARDL